MHIGSLQTYNQLRTHLDTLFSNDEYSNTIVRVLRDSMSVAFKARNVYVGHTADLRMKEEIARRYRQSLREVAELMEEVKRLKQEEGFAVGGNMGIVVKDPKPLTYMQAMLNLGGAWYAYLYPKCGPDQDKKNAVEAYISSFGSRKEAYDALIRALDEYYSTVLNDLEKLTPPTTDASSMGGSSGADTSEAGTSCADTSEADTSGAGSSEADTSGADTSGAGSSGADTSGADTSGAGSSEADTSGVGSSGADTSGAGSSGADTSGAGSSGADTSGAGSSEGESSEDACSRRDRRKTTRKNRKCGDQVLPCGRRRRRTHKQRCDPLPPIGTHQAFSLAGGLCMSTRRLRPVRRATGPSGASLGYCKRQVYARRSRGRKGCD
jgi:hypothetical protein